MISKGSTVNFPAQFPVAAAGEDGAADWWCELLATPGLAVVARTVDGGACSVEEAEVSTAGIVDDDPAA